MRDILGPSPFHPVVEFGCALSPPFDDLHDSSEAVSFADVEVSGAIHGTRGWIFKVCVHSSDIIWAAPGCGLDDLRGQSCGSKQAGKSQQMNRTKLE